MKDRAKNTVGKAWLKRETRSYRGVVLFLTVLVVAATLASLAFAYLVRYLINSASAGKSSKLWIFSGVLLGVLLIKILLRTAKNFISERLRAKMYSELRTKTFSGILCSDYTRLQAYHSGDLLNRLTGDVQEICTDTVGLLPAVAGMLVQCLGAIIALATIDPLFTGIYVLCGIVFGSLTALFRRKIKKYHKEVLQADGETRSFIQEGLSSVVTVKAYGAEGKVTERTKDLSNIYYKKRMNRNYLRSNMDFLFSLLSNFGLIFAVVWCSISVLNGNDDYGAILSVILLLMQLQQPLTSISSVLPVYYSRIASAERLAEIEELPKEDILLEENEIESLYDDMQSLHLQNIEFSYDKDKVLTGASMQIQKGEIVCLTGASGSGKSTIFKLLLHVFQPNVGEILIDGKTCLSLNASHRGLFAYVPQGNFLTSGTIYDNLTFFSSKQAITEEEICSALQVACADFVFSLPNGLQTNLLEGGEGLSEGQLQRLNVARALLSKRPILLFDEVTSALDGETEEKLLQNIRKLKGKTCLIVTHRPAALEIADRILRVENGKIEELTK